MIRKIRSEVKSELKNGYKDFPRDGFEKIYSNKIKPRRTSLRVLGDILGSIKEAGRQGLIVSNISRKANLAYYITMEKCQSLVSAGLIEEKILDKKKVYVITEKGLEFNEEYENFQSLVDPLNLRY